MRTRCAWIKGVLLLLLAVWHPAHADFEAGLAALAAQDYRTAFREFKTAADAGSAEAQYSLAQMYEVGQGVALDYAAALHWYRQSAEQGFELAQNNLGYMFENGEGVNPDPLLAVQWYQKAAVQGYALAQFNLGRMYAEGSGIRRDYIQAYFWSALAATQGDQNAKNNMQLLASRMDSAQIASAQELLKLWFRQRGESEQPEQLPAPTDETAGVVRI